MFLVDDVLLFPVRGILWVFREIHHAAEAEMANEAETITARLSELYMELETGRMTEAEFDAEEKRLLDRLEVIEARGKGTAAQQDDEDDGDDATEYVVLDRKTAP
jgi:hypothetical protein